MPWNGYKAAISLTFDDGDPIHLDLVIPEMRKRGMKGTFFLIADKIERLEEWQKAAVEGIEIGNHSANHRHASELSADDEEYEVDGAEKFLREKFEQPVITFAYPFTEISTGLRARVEKNCIIARGGGWGNSIYTPVMEPDWYDIRCQASMTSLGFDTYKSWVDAALGAGAWTVFMIHAIEGSNWFQPVPKDIFLKLLDYLKQNEKEIWTAPFGEIGAYWKAQKAVEAAVPVKKSGKYMITWKKPVPFPAGVSLKVRVEEEGSIITQAGKIIEPDSTGVYRVLFDAGELTIAKRNRTL
jgi:sialate O-acetylesterase